MPGAVQYVIMHKKIRFRGFDVARGQILSFCIELLRRLYNILSLSVPCECVILVVVGCSL